MKFKEFGTDLRILAKREAPQEPKVTIIMPTYARGHGPLQESIDSVLAQSYDDFELIVVDDGSRDDTSDVLAEYQNRDSRVVIHHYDKNSGLPALRVNQAALRSKGEYIAYQFDDDLWTKDSLEIRVNELEKYSEPTVVYGNAELEVYLEDGTVEKRVLGQDFNYGLLVNGNYIANNTVIHHKEIFEMAGMYDPHILARRFSDYDLWIRFAKYSKFVWVNHKVSKVRANLTYSLGQDAPLNFTIQRKYLGFDRRKILQPSVIDEYNVISLNHFDIAVSEIEKDKLIRSEMMSFLVKNSDYWAEPELYLSPATRRSKTRLLTAKPDFSTSVNVTIENFINLENQNLISNTFVQEHDLSAVDLSGFDIVILYRTIGEQGNAVISKKDNQLPSVYLMDDNMLHFHEVGAEHAVLAPGTPIHNNIIFQISGADACIGYSDAIIEDMYSLNPRTIRLDTNIQQRYVEKRDYTRGSRFRLAILSGPVRREILLEIWPAITSFAKRNAKNIEIHFWGLDPDNFGKLDCPVFSKPFTHSYDSYLRGLHHTAFDFVLVPLDFSTRAAKSKSPVKLLEALVTGAICIFTDAPPYSELPDDCCLKTSNSCEDWEKVLELALSMSKEERDDMLERARKLVLNKYTTESQFFDFAGTFDAVKLHSRLKDKAIAFSFHEPALGGATLHLIRHASLIKSLGFSVVGVVPKNDIYIEAFRSRWNAGTGNAPLIIEKWQSGYVAHESGETRQREFTEQDHVTASRISQQLRGMNVGLLHFATWSPVMCLTGRQLNIPTVASVHQYYEGSEESIAQFADAIHCSSLTHGNVWERLSKVPTRRIVCPVDDVFYELFQINNDHQSLERKEIRILVSGTIQPRKNQLEAMRAVVQLIKEGHEITLDVIGYDEFYPEYADECRRIVEDAGMHNRINFHGFIDDVVPFYKKADILLISAVDESMPQTMLQAMAAGVAVISTKVGGVAEIIKHRYSGFLIEDTSAHAIFESLQEYISLPIAHKTEIISRAHRALMILGRPSYVRSEIVDLYNQAWDQNHAKLALSGIIQNVEKPGEQAQFDRAAVEQTCSQFETTEREAELVKALERVRSMLQSERG